MPVTILALDPATKTGWAVCDEDGIYRGNRGVWEPKLLKQEAEAGRHGRICAFLTARLSSWIDVHQPALVVLEENNGGRINQKVRQRITGCFLSLCHRRHIAAKFVTAREWQGYASEHFGWTRADKDDALDAEMILRWAIANLNIVTGEAA